MSKEYDLVVVGGGLSGVCAAISAARLGSVVALVQDRPVLGGNSSSEIRVRLAGSGAEVQLRDALNGVGNIPWMRETGIIEELFAEDRAKDPTFLEDAETCVIWDLVLYDKVRREENIDLFLNTHATGVKTKGGEVKEITCTQLGSEKTLQIKGEVFVDATGDGTIAALGGAEFRWGREGRKEFGEACAPEEPDDQTMGNTLLFHSRDVGHPVEFEPPPWAARFASEDDLPFRRHGRISDGYWWIEVGNPPFNTIEDSETIRDELLKQLMGVWDHIKNQGDHGAENYALDWIGMVPGKRESRRIIGDYILNEKDLKSLEPFPDRVAYGGWFMDRHTPGGILAKYEPPEPVHTGDIEMMKDEMVPGPYSIPLRSLYSKDLKNLFTAGRNVSASHVAMASSRQMATCAVMGQAVGTAAHLCTKYHTVPRALCRDHIEEVQQLLLKQDCYIPMVENQDEEDLARNATVSVSSASPLDFIDGGQRDDLEFLRAKILPDVDEFPAAPQSDELNVERAQLFPVTADRLESVSLFLESKRTDDVELSIGLRKAEHVWDFTDTDDIAVSSATVKARSKGWITFQLDQNLAPNQLYWVRVSEMADIFWKRCGNHPIGTVSAFMLIDVWKAQKHVYDMKLAPIAQPYQGSNILRGAARPEKWTNAWVSDPKESFPQWLEIDFGKAVEFNSVYLTLDTGLTRSFFYIPPFYRAPECVKEYQITCLMESKEWKTLVEVKNNFERRCVHTFAPVVSSKLRLTVHATNGAPSAHVYEIRVYKEV